MAICRSLFNIFVLGFMPFMIVFPAQRFRRFNDLQVANLKLKMNVYKFISKNFQFSISEIALVKIFE